MRSKLAESMHVSVSVSAATPVCLPLVLFLSFSDQPVELFLTTDATVFATVKDELQALIRACQQIIVSARCVWEARFVIKTL